MNSIFKVPSVIFEETCMVLGRCVPMNTKLLAFPKVWAHIGAVKAYKQPLQMSRFKYPGIVTLKRFAQHMEFASCDVVFS